MKSSSTTKPEAGSAPAGQTQKVEAVPDDYVVKELTYYRTIAEMVNQLETLPREKYAERDYILRNLWEAQLFGRIIGNYESLISEDDKRALGSNMREVVTAIFGQDAVENVLLKGIDNPENKIDKRIKFLKFLERNLVAPPGKQSFRRFKGDYDPKKADEATVKMEEFFSEKGVDLYRDAVREEGESAAFRLALAYKATQYFKGPKLQQLMYIWVGGASGSGKSFGASGVIQALLKHMKNLGEGDIQGNYFSFVDGGVTRQLSQVRKLALKIALRCGFSSIEDLNDISGRNDPLDLKKLIHNTAVESGRVNVIIPETFSGCVVPMRCKDISDAEMLTRNKRMLHVFSEVAPPEGKVEEFKKQLVPRMAGERANSKQYGEEFRQLIRLDQLNLLDLPCESKAPPSVTSIGFGINGTALARDVYLASGESGKKAERFPRIHLVILNELMYIDYLGVNQSLRIAASDFANYQKAVGNTPTQQLSIQQWFNEMKREKKLAPAQIIIERFDVDADRREFCELINQASRAAGLTQPALSKEKAADKRAIRQSQSMLQVDDPQSKELIRRLAHFANVLATKDEIPIAARAEMLDVTGKRICQLIFTGVPKGGPTVGAEINVVRDDYRKFAEWMALLNNAVRQSSPDEQAEARRLVFKEWQTQILQSYAPANEKVQALQELYLSAEAFLTRPQVRPADQVAALLRDIQSNMRQLSGAPAAPQPAPQQTRPVAAPRDQPQPPKAAPRPQSTPANVVKQPVPPPRPADPVKATSAGPNNNNEPRAPIPAPRAPIPAARANSAPPVKQEQAKAAAPAKVASNPSGFYAHPAPANSPGRPPARPAQAPVVADESTKNKTSKTPGK